MNPVRQLSRYRPLALAAVLLLGAAACDDGPAPLVEIEGTGDIEGLVFLDADENGIYDPAGGDIAVPGISLRVQERSGTDTLAAPVTTAANGRFVFSGLPLGTHEIVFDEATVPEGVSICQNPVPVTVRLDETTFANVQGRPACLITIAAAQEAELGEFVIVRGVVTSSPNQQANNWTIIEDATGGIQLFTSSLTGLGIEIGDLIEVGGELGQFGARLELLNVELREHIPDFGALTPEVTTIDVLAQGGAMRSPLQNRLFTIRGAELTTAFTAGGSRNATITDATGAMLMRVEPGVSAGSGDAILTTLGIEVGKCYDITGILGTFNGTPQFFPRAASDLEEVPCS